MPRSSRLAASAALVALACLGLSGCAGLTSIGKGLGIIQPPKLDLSGPMPQDFELRIKVIDQTTPAADYLLIYRRSGRCDYRMEVRAPKRRESSGSFDILEGQVAALYEQVRQMDYASIPERYPADGTGNDKALGVQAYSVRANDLSREVQTHHTAVPALEKLRTLALSYLPPRAMADTGPGTPEPGKSRLIIGDVKTKIFYPADDPRLKDVPADRRQPFPAWEDALNFGYSPAPGFEPWNRKE